jgi:AcrR family transcriptional regulator
MSPSQSERSAATRAALIAAARTLWGARGYAEVGTPEIATAAGVTRGAMYHQYADKAALFRAVIDAVESEAMQRLVTEVAAAEPPTSIAALHVAVDAWLKVAAETEIRQLVLIDGPTVLGWTAFRELNQRYALGMTEELLTAAIAAGEVPDQPVRPLASILLGAVDEAAMTVAEAEDPSAARSEALAVLAQMIDGLAGPA